MLLLLFGCVFFQKQRQGFLILLINLNICLCMCGHVIFCFSIRWHQILSFIIQRLFELYNLLYLFKINLLLLKKIKKYFLCVFFNAILSSSTHCRFVIVTSLDKQIRSQKEHLTWILGLKVFLLLEDWVGQIPPVLVGVGFLCLS